VADTIADFLEMLYGDLDGRFLGLFCTPGPKIENFTDLSKARDYAAKASMKDDVYYRVGLMSSVPLKGRGLAVDTTAVPGLWLDVDFAGKEHTKKVRYPPDQKTALRLIRACGVEPSIIVNSGNGLHAYWLYKELWILDSQAEHEEASKLNRLWEATIRASLGVKGFTCDTVYSLDHLLRLPGTFNRKGEVKEVSIVRVNADLRYNPGDFENYLIDQEYVPDKSRSPVTVGFVCLDPQAEPPSAKLSVLLQNNPEFKRTWDRERGEEFSDKSASAYDMSLASFAVTVGWSDQEVANLILAWRRRHKEDPKLRLDYFQRTLGRARSTCAIAVAMEKLAGNNAITRPRNPTINEKKELFELLSVALGLQINSWVQRGRERATYTLSVTVSGDTMDIHFPNVESVLTQLKFRALVYQGAAIMIPGVKAPKWLRLCEHFASVVDLAAIEESERPAETLSWLRVYFADVHPPKGDDWKVLFAQGMPHINGSQIFLSVTNFLRFLFIHTGERIERSDVYSRLSAVGLCGKNFSARVDKRTKSLFLWVGPCSILEAPE